MFRDTTAIFLFIIHSLMRLISHTFIYRIYSCISWGFSAEFWRQSFGSRLICRSCHTTTVNTAWTISRPLCLQVCVGEWVAGGGATPALLWLRLHTS